MANQSTGYGIISGSLLTDHGTTALNTLGARRMDKAGNEYIYLTGVASTAAGSWVTYDEAYLTSLLTSNAFGLVAIAQAATVASEYGWYLIYGSGTGVIGNEVSADKAAYISSVTGSVDDLLVTGDMVHGAIIRGASAVTGASVAVQVSYPFVNDNVV
jgi:hypothetical protein